MEINKDTAKIIDTLCESIFEANVNAGWWTDHATDTPLRDNPLTVPLKLALVHSEVSEALEGYRKNLKDDHLTERDAFGVELADAVIRILDLAGACGVPLGTLIMEKNAYNNKRADHKVANRKAANGKRF